MAPWYNCNGSDIFNVSVFVLLVILGGGFIWATVLFDDVPVREFSSSGGVIIDTPSQVRLTDGDVHLSVAMAESSIHHDDSMVPIPPVTILNRRIRFFSGGLISADLDSFSSSEYITLQHRLFNTQFRFDSFESSIDELRTAPTMAVFEQRMNVFVPHAAPIRKFVSDKPGNVPRDVHEFRRVIVPESKLSDSNLLGASPIIGSDGRKAWQIYAGFHEFTGDRPRIAVVLGRLGYSLSATRAAIQQLPGAVTLGFMPYAPHLVDWISEARAAGHEVLLQIPMESNSYPNKAPGPHTLLTNLSAAENIGRLEWLLGRGSGYVGVTNILGSRFISSSDHVRPILNELKSRGLLYLDASTSRTSVVKEVATELGLPNITSNSFLDIEASRGAIDAKLYELEHIAMDFGSAVGIGAPYPVTIERIAAWAATLDSKGLALVPVSALVAEGTNSIDGGLH